MHRNLSDVSTKQERIATLAKQSPEMGFTSLAYLMDEEWLHEAYRRTRKSGAVGVDGQTAADYEQSLESNLRSLLDRAKSGRYGCAGVRAHLDVCACVGTGASVCCLHGPTLAYRVR